MTEDHACLYRARINPVTLRAIPEIVVYAIPAICVLEGSILRTPDFDVFFWLPGDGSMRLKYAVEP